MDEITKKMCAALLKDRSHWTVDGITRLLASGLDVNGKIGNCPPLFIACEANQPGVVKLLLAADGIDVNSTGIGNGHNPSPPLYFACQKKQVEIVKLLLAHDGIDVNVKGKHGYHAGTPLHLACKIGHVELVKLLLEVPGIDILAVGKYYNHDYRRWDDEGNCLDVASTPEIKALVAEIRDWDAVLVYFFSLHVGDLAKLVGSGFLLLFIYITSKQMTSSSTMQ